MHELSICQRIFQTLEEELPTDDLVHLQEIHLEIGVLAGVQPAYLKNAFELVITDTIYKKVRLVIAYKQIVVECHHCKHRFEVKACRFVCPACENASSNVIEGNELKISQIVIEEPKEAER